MTTWHKYATHAVEAISAIAFITLIAMAGHAGWQITRSAGVPAWAVALAVAAPAGAVARLSREARGAVVRYSNWRDARLDDRAARTPATSDDPSAETPPARAVDPLLLDVTLSGDDMSPEAGTGPTESAGIPDDEGRQDQDHDDRNGRNGIDLSGNIIGDVRRSHGATSTSARDQGRFVAGDDHDRFWSKVDKSTDPDGCWTWTGGLSDDGYGRFRIVTEGQARHVKAHRWAYETEIGPIDDGLTVDQDDDRCRNRACVRPDHLEAVTRAENIRRAAAWRRTNRTDQP